jgi:hypothetical protein
VPEATLGEALDAYVKVNLSDSASPPKTTVLVPAPPIAAWQQQQLVVGGVSWSGSGAECRAEGGGWRRSRGIGISSGRANTSNAAWAKTLLAARRWRFFLYWLVQRHPSAVSLSQNGFATASSGPSLGLISSGRFVLANECLGKATSSLFQPRNHSALHSSANPGLLGPHDERSCSVSHATCVAIPSGQTILAAQITLLG